MTPLIRDVTATELDLSLPQSPMLNSDNELYSAKSVDLSAGVVPTPADATLHLKFEIVDGGTGTGTITDAGVLTGGDPGTVNVKVTDQKSGLSTELTVTVCEYEAPEEFTPNSVEPLSTAANCPIDVMIVQLYNPEGGKTGLVNIKPKVTVTGTGSEDVETFVLRTGDGNEDQCGYYFNLQADSEVEGTFTIRVEDEISGMYAERQVTFAEAFASAISIDAQSGRVAAGGEKDLGVSTTPQDCETELSFTVSDSLGEVVTRYNGLKPYYVFVAGNTAGFGTITVSDQLSGQTASCEIQVLGG